MVWYQTTQNVGQQRGKCWIFYIVSIRFCEVLLVACFHSLKLLCSGLSDVFGWNKGSVWDNSIVNFRLSCSFWPSGINANSRIGMEDFHCHNNLDLVLSCPSSSKTVSAASLHPQWEEGGNKGRNKGIKIEHPSNCESLLMTWATAQLQPCSNYHWTVIFATDCVLTTTLALFEAKMDFGE